MEKKYRMLQDGERLQEGDEFEDEGVWYKTNLPTMRITKEDVGYYRRPISQEENEK